MIRAGVAVCDSQNCIFKTAFWGGRARRPVHAIFENSLIDHYSIFKLGVGGKEVFEEKRRSIFILQFSLNPALEVGNIFL